MRPRSKCGRAAFYRNTVWQYGLQIAKYLFPLITLPYLTRVLEPEGYALYAYVVSFMSFAQVLVDFGFNLSGTKRIAAVRDAKEEGRIVGGVTQARLVLCLVTGCVVMVIASLIPITSEHFLYVLLAYVAVCGRGLLPDFVFQGHENMGPITTRFVISKGISTALTFVVVHSASDLIWVPILDIFSNGIALVWSFASAKRLFDTKVIAVPMREALVELKSSGMYCFSNMAATAFSGFTTLLVGVVITDEAVISYWSLAMTAISAVQSLYTPITNSLYPHIVKSGDYGFVRKICLIALPISIVGTISFALLSNLIILVLGGEEYLPGAWVLVWVSPVLFFSFFALLFGWPVLGAAGKVAEVTKSTIISAVFCIAALLMLSFVGAASLQVICVVRCATEALLLLLRLEYALPILRGKEIAGG